jgi:hypothetical protein
MISYRQADLLKSLDENNSVVFETSIWPLNQQGMLGLTPIGQGNSNAADPRKYDYASSIHGRVAKQFVDYLLHEFNCKNFIIRQPESAPSLEKFVTQEFAPGFYEYATDCIGGTYSPSGEQGINIHFRFKMP